MNELLDTVGRPGERMIKIGRTGSRNHQFSVPAEAFDGRVTIITGRKESGKSHLAKMMVRGLLQQGAYCIIFDLNDEYGSIGLKADGSSTDIAKKVDVRRPGRNLKFSLAGSRSARHHLAPSALARHDGHFDPGVHPHLGGHGG